MAQRGGAPPTGVSRTVFVANIPFDVSEEQLSKVFGEAGPVSSVEIKFDPNTGRSKGYAFVHFYDEATAASAVRNLKDVQVNGRNLRVELSTDEPGPRRRKGGGDERGGSSAPYGGGAGGGGGGYGDRSNGPPPPSGYGGPPSSGPPGYGPPGGAGGYGGPPPPQPSQLPPPGRRDDTPPVRGGGRVDLDMLPPGAELQPGQTAADAISKTLAAVSPGQMQDVMSSMKTLITTNPAEARQLLHQKPQLAYALFQAMLLMNIVDPSVLQRIQPLPPQAQPSYPPQPAPSYPAYNAPPPPQQQQQQYRPPPPPQQSGYGAPQGYGGYGAPAPAPPPPQQGGLASLPPAAQAALAGLAEDQRAMLVQVLTLTPDQVAQLDAEQRAGVVQIRQQFLGTA